MKRKENPARGGVEKVAADGGRDGRRCLTNAAVRLEFPATETHAPARLSTSEFLNNGHEALAVERAQRREHRAGFLATNPLCDNR